MRSILPYFLALFIISLNTAVLANKVINKTENIYTEDKQNIAVYPQQPDFTIKLKSNPTTGYAWFLREYDASLVIPVKHQFEKPTQQLIGEPGYERWTFHIKPAGFIVPQQTTLRLIYTRPWQGMDSATQLVFRITTLPQDKR